LSQRCLLQILHPHDGPQKLIGVSSIHPFAIELGEGQRLLIQENPAFGQHVYCLYQVEPISQCQFRLTGQILEQGLLVSSFQIRPDVNSIDSQHPFLAPSANFTSQVGELIISRPMSGFQA
jgi:hypothetical protein